MKCARNGSHWYFTEIWVSGTKNFFPHFIFLRFNSYCGISRKKYIKLFIFVTFMQNNNPLYGYFTTNLFSHTHQLGISHIIHIYAASYQSLQKQLGKINIYEKRIK